MKKSQQSAAAGSENSGLPAPPRRAVRLVAYALMVFLTLCLIEGFVLLGLSFPDALNAAPTGLHDAFRRFYIRRDMYMPTLSPDCGRYDSETFYTLKPGSCRFVNREFDVRYDINSAGLRDDEASLKAPDVILLGDSEAMGWALSNAETLAPRLEEATGLKLLNAGMPSYGTARELIMLRRLDRSRLKALMLQYNTNDYSENVTYNADGKLNIRSAEEYAEWSRNNEKRRRYTPFRYTYYFIKDNLRRWKNLPDNPVTLEQEVAAFLPPFREIASLVPGIPIILFEMGGGNAKREGFAAAVAAALQKVDPGLAARIRPVRLADGFTREMIFDLDWHFNAKGHAYVSDRLKQALTGIRQGSAK